MVYQERIDAFTLHHGKLVEKLKSNRDMAMDKAMEDRFGNAIEIMKDYEFVLVKKKNRS